eukprot:gnl/TRDRNA2_/TRDRNA2_153455_c1_seq3.p1 gnl/TRDRNA2_/TRDRNA2_153455_c1~~gnl/TRDRNA2_/TRDRNA2_153455_c1_seq3.p1  ORF type:complete len:100 (+),score=3.54 gnl/TRDRNA2_/TRDRNA2_153455_c1_seq3:238-537(+)
MQGWLSVDQAGTNWGNRFKHYAAVVFAVAVAQTILSKPPSLFLIIGGVSPSLVVCSYGLFVLRNTRQSTATQAIVRGKDSEHVQHIAKQFSLSSPVGQP